MTNEATPKKKGCLGLIVKSLIGFTAFGVVLGVVGQMMIGGQIKGCNDGKAADCEALLESDYPVEAEFDTDRITNKEFKSKFVAKVEAAKKEVADREAKAGAVNALVEAMAVCENSLKAAMKDPDSFVVHNRDFETLQIEYSATNSYGGRLRNVIDCKTGKNLR